jgi:uncharacterized BrkB/YihY/UPF0761 family membrane protein
VSTKSGQHPALAGAAEPQAVRRGKTLTGRLWSVAFLAIPLLLVWSLVFWLVALMGLGGKVLGIPLGALGGAVYPNFFMLPVILGTAVYQLLLTGLGSRLSNARPVVWHFVVPGVMIAVALFVFCPTEWGPSFPVAVLRAITGRA